MSLQIRKEITDISSNRVFDIIVRMKTVLLFRSSFCRSNRLEYDGVFAAAEERGWRVQTIEYRNAATNRYRLQDEAAGPDVTTLLKFWNPDGCIVECGIAPRALMKKDFGKVPVVFLDRDPDTVEREAVCIHSDSDAIAETAARELLRLGLDDFAFLAWPEPVEWSEERGRRFGEIIRGHGKHFRSFRMSKTDKPELDLAKLESFLSTLPRPCGLFTANDVLAKLVDTACAHAKIAVPDDLAIVSVDNDEDICEHTSTTLTSIELDFAGAGVKSVELLDLMMSGHSRKARTWQFGVNRLVRRKSAIGFRHLDKRMNDALEFIRINACKAISIADIVKVMGCSRRLADMRFRATLDRTILDEIHLRRLDVAKIMLRHRKTADEIAASCGYGSPDDFRRVFRRYAGQSPLRWLKAQSP